MKYKVLANQEEAYELAKCTARTVKALRLLQASSAYYTDLERYAISKEQCLKGFITKEERTEESINFEITEPELSTDNFRDEVAKLLFPSAPVSDNMDEIDYSEVEEGLNAFLNFIEPRHRRQKALLASLRNSLTAPVGNIGAETQTGDQ